MPSAALRPHPSPIFTIAPATRADIPALAHLAKATFAATFEHLYSTEDLNDHISKKYNESTFCEALNTPKTNILLARLGQQIIGYMQLGTLTLPVADAATGAMEIQRLYLLHAHHGQGYADQLMHTALALPALATAPEIYLGVWAENHRALAFYTRHAFTRCGEYDYAVGNQVDVDWILRREGRNRAF